MENEQQNKELEVIPGGKGGFIHPWKQGVSGNPEGKKKGTLHFKTIIKKILDTETTVDIDGVGFRMTCGEAMIYGLVQMALKSQNDLVKLRAITELIDRMDGKPVPVMPDNQGDQQTDQIVFYIPNEHSRLK
jgi:Family of unknown function (DUF5681)